jgi:gamma-tubulin complex component 2
MQTCTIFATYTNWLTKELEKADPDLTATVKPDNMTDKQWQQFQAIKAQRQQQQQSQPSNGDGIAKEEEDGEGKTHGGGVEDARIAELSDMMRKWETNFSRHLQILLDALNHYAATETVVLLSLCARLSTANQGTEYAGLRSEEEGPT